MKHLKTLSKLGVIGAGMCLSLGSASAQVAELPDGPGKDIVQANCTLCHGPELITAKRRSPDEWSEVLNRMLASGAQLDEDQFGKVLAYLKGHFGTTPAASDFAGKSPSAAAAPASHK